MIGAIKVGLAEGVSYKFGNFVERGGDPVPAQISGATARDDSTNYYKLGFQGFINNLNFQINNGNHRKSD